MHIHALTVGPVFYFARFEKIVCKHILISDSILTGLIGKIFHSVFLSVKLSGKNLKYSYHSVTEIGEIYYLCPERQAVCTPCQQLKAQ